MATYTKDASVLGSDIKVRPLLNVCLGGTTTRSHGKVCQIDENMAVVPDTEPLVILRELNGLQVVALVEVGRVEAVS